MGRLDRAARAAYDRWFRRGSAEGLRRRGLTAGRNLNIMRGAYVDPSHCWHITIGDDVTIARNAIVLAHDASTNARMSLTRIGKVDIGDRVFIGASAIVLPGVRIGSDVVVGAGTVVTTDIPDGVVAAGNPARVIAKLDEWMARREAEANVAPVFGREYQDGNGVTAAMKTEMNERMVDRFGYVGKGRAGQP
jgi:maltose O-acetyltransferase